MRQTGKILYFMKLKAFGFIRTLDLKDHWFHVSQWKEFQDPKAGLLVSFDTLTRDDGREYCMDVRRVTNEELAQFTIAREEAESGAAQEAI